MSKTLKHSKLGITSSVIGLGAWAYVLLLTYVYLYTKIINDIFPNNVDFIIQFVEAIILLFIYLAVPCAGYIVGLSFGLVGSIQKDRNRLFAAIGLILNILPFALLMIFYLHGDLK